MKPVISCVRARKRPHLDGRLDEAVWREARQTALTSASTTTAIGRPSSCWPTTTSIFTLPPNAANRPVPASAGGDRLSEDNDGKSPSRPRDGDLSAYDRVQFLLDIDRDFATYYELAVDRRGWTNDRCWEDRTWDPQWFVATRREPGRWTVEAAIPLKELTGKPPRSGDVWALGLQRVVPGVGFQSWTNPAAAARRCPTVLDTWYFSRRMGRIETMCAG